MPNQFGLAGANPGKQTKLAPIYTGRWSSGIWTNRSPLRDAATSRIVEKFYGAAGDALISGSNVEITNRLTLARRPGNTVFPNETSPFLPSFGPVYRFYDFRLFNSTSEQIVIMVDQVASLQAINGQLTSVVFLKSAGAGQSYMQSVGNTLYFGDGVDNKKWLQTLFNGVVGGQWQPNQMLNTPTTPYMSTYLIDPNGNLQQLTGTEIQILDVFSSLDVVEIFVNSNVPLYTVMSPGQVVTFPYGMAATWLDGQTVTVTQVGIEEFLFNFITGYYPATPEVNKFVTLYPGDGTPTTGSTQPIWSTSIPQAKFNFQGGITIDGTVQWTNRGNPVENWGIQPPTAVLTPSVIGSLPAWAEHTYYSLPGVIVDTNGNLQQVIQAGLSGSSITWATTLNSLTYDGLPSTGIIWKMIASAGMMVWEPYTYYPLGSFIIASASSTNCLFQSVASSAPYITGSVSAYLFPHSHSVGIGDFDLTYPVNLGSATATGLGLTGWDFAISGTGTGGSFVWNTINSSGATTGTTNPFPGQDVSDLNIIITGVIEVPAAGQYTFTVTHGDGLMWGIGGGAIFVSGSAPQNITSLTTAANGYPTFNAGNNVNVTYNSGNAWVDTYTVDFTNIGTYPVEFNLARWDKPNAGLTVLCGSNVMASGQPPSSGGATSGATQPSWPAWTLADAPAYPFVDDAQGLIQWDNIGPSADYAWFATTNYTLADTTIVDGNGNIQAPYLAGRTATVTPTWNTTVGNLTADPNPNLEWINQGKSTAPPGGTITTSNGGWVYSISLVNTLDDTVSNATPISAATGDFTDAQGVKLYPGDGLQGITIDPQADYVAIWRSTDGEVQPFLIPGENDYDLPITLSLFDYLTYGYLDTTPDVGLDNLIEAPILGQNTPPAAGASNLAYYLNRIFYSVGNTVYWTSGPETPAGNGLNGSAPLNYDEQVALVHRIVPTTPGALVFTVSDVNIITSSTSANGTTINPAQAFPLLEGVGLSSYNALDTNGSTIGLFTTDHQFIIVSPSTGVSTAGFPIGDQFRLDNGVPGQSWNPASVYVAWHVNGEDQAWYVADGKNGWYRLMATPAPEQGGVTWSPFATLATGAGCVQSVETSPGTHNLLIGPVTSGYLLVRNLDSSMDSGMTYPANAVLGSAVLAQPGQIAVVQFITTESVNIGTPLVLGLFIDEALPYYNGPFDILKDWKNDPPSLRPSRSVYGQRFYLSELQEDAAMMRHCQIQVNWPNEAYQNELLTLTIFGGFLQEE
jgi:hypothetical protein